MRRNFYEEGESRMQTTGEHIEQSLASFRQVRTFVELVARSAFVQFWHDRVISAPEGFVWQLLGGKFSAAAFSTAG